MAIDRTGISSLETGAPEIKLTGNQDPREPNQKFAGGGKRGWMAQERAMEIAEDEYGRDFYDLNDTGCIPCSLISKTYCSYISTIIGSAIAINC